jgi:hypothetical protein
MAEGLCTLTAAHLCGCGDCTFLLCAFVHSTYTTSHNLHSSQQPRVVIIHDKQERVANAGLFVAWLPAGHVACCSGKAEVSFRQQQGAQSP